MENDKINIDEILEKFKVSEENLKKSNEELEKLKVDFDNLKKESEELKKYNQVLLVNANTNIPQKPTIINADEEYEKHIEELKQKINDNFSNK